MVLTDQMLSLDKENQYNLLIKHYEDKDYKKGLKVADNILKAFPKNAKTICMRNLMDYLLNGEADKHEKAIKGAVLTDAKNSACWQTLGLFYRHAEKYEEARKAFMMAYMKDNKNLQLLIDLVSLCAQCGDFAGVRNYSQLLFAQFPTESRYWVGFFIGLYFEGNYSKCIDGIQTYRDTLPKEKSYLRQELYFLECECQMILKNYEAAVNVLEDGREGVLNGDAADERLALLYALLNREEKSKEVWLRLIKRNGDCYDYYKGIERCLLQCWDGITSLKDTPLPSSSSLSPEQIQVLEAFYTSLPPSTTVTAIRLGYLQKKEFEFLCKETVLRVVRKGVPSFFKSIRNILDKQPEKLFFLKELCTLLLASLQQNGYIEKGIEEEPCVELWLEYLLAQIFDYQRETEKALEHIEKALLHTPTCYDVYVLKAKVLKHAGDWKKAADAMEEGSTLDKADRYMNTKYVKYLLRNQEIEKADKVLSYWIKKGKDPRDEMKSLEACWYENACGDSYYARGDYVHANKLYTTVTNHFDKFIIDQFSFHAYAMRKSIIMGYLDFVKHVKTLYSHSYYVHAAIGVLRCSLRFFEKPITPSEHKKLFKSIEKKTEKKGKKGDEDPDGYKLATVENPLQSVKGVATLLLKNTHDEDAMSVVFDWSVACKEKDMALSSLKILEEGKNRLLWEEKKKRWEQIEGVERV